MFELLSLQIFFSDFLMRNKREAKNNWPPSSESVATLVQTKKIQQQQITSIVVFFKNSLSLRRARSNLNEKDTTDVSKNSQRQIQ